MLVGHDSYWCYCIVVNKADFKYGWVSCVFDPPQAFCETNILSPCLSLLRATCRFFLQIIGTFIHSNCDSESACVCAFVHLYNCQREFLHLKRPLCCRLNSFKARFFHWSAVTNVSWKHNASLWTFIPNYMVSNNGSPKRID